MRLNALFLNGFLLLQTFFLDHFLWKYVLIPDFEERIVDFATAIFEANIHSTPKLHVVIDHVIEYCKDTIDGLGKASEQASESIHHVFTKFATNFNSNFMSKKCGEVLLLKQFITMFIKTQLPCNNPIRTIANDSA